MKQPLHNLHTEANKISLSYRERELMRANIFDTVPVVRKVSVRSSYRWFSLRYATPVALLLVVVLGGGTAYAAEGSLPGEPLYTVKLNVTEPFREVLAVSDAAKAQFHASVAVTRLEEAETLASRGRLDATTTQEIQKNFDDHVAKADELSSSLQARDPGAAVEVTTQLDSSLSAHGEILSQLARESGDEDTRSNSDSIAMNARSHGRGGESSGFVVAVASVMNAPEQAVITAPVAPTARIRTISAKRSRGEAESTIAAVSTGTPLAVASISNRDSGRGSSDNAEKNNVNRNPGLDQRIATQLLGRTSGVMSELQNSFSSIQENLGTTSGTVAAQILDLKTQLQNANAQMSAGDYAGAQMTLMNVLQGATKLSTLLQASQKFDHGFLQSLFDNRSKHGESGDHGGGEGGE